MVELKPGWRRLRFDQMVTSAGATRKARGWSAATAGVERYVGLEHIDSNSPTIRRWGSPEDVGENSDLRPFEAGDVILARRGIEQRKVGFATFDGVASGHALVFRARPGVMLPEFLPYFLLSEAFMGRVDQFSAGSLSKTVNLTTLLRLEFTLPPLEEQRHSLQLLQAYENAWRAADYLAGSARILFHAVIEHFHEEAAARWPKSALASLVEQDRPITYGILMPGTGHEGGVPVIKVKDFPDGQIDPSDLLRTSPAIATSYKRSELRPNDILVSIRGTIGRIAVVPGSLAGANITQDSARLSFRDEILPEFARAMLESASGQRMLKSNIPPPAPAGMPPAKAKPRDSIQGLNIGELRRVQLPVPPVEVQAEIVEAVSQARAAMRATALRAQDLQAGRAVTIEASLWGRRGLQ